MAFRIVPMSIPFIHVITESTRIARVKFLLSNYITCGGNNQAMITMTSEAYLFAWQYPNDIQNTLLRHLGIPQDFTRPFAEKKKPTGLLS